MLPLLGNNLPPGAWVVCFEVLVLGRKLLLQQGLERLIDKYGSAEVA